MYTEAQPKRESVIAFHASVDSDKTGKNLIKELSLLQKRGINTLFLEIGYNYQREENLFCRGVLPPLNNGTEYKTTRRLSVNMPSQIIARVPKEVPAGAVTVIVRTKYSAGAKPLAEIREIIYGYPCTAKT